METRLPRVFTIAPSAGFLETLADAVLQGLPNDTPPDSLSLARTTILVPTRRAARALEQLLYKRKSATGLLLPRIRPIGDIDEDLFGDEPQAEDAADLPDAISPGARQFLLLDLVTDWVRDHRDSALAREIAVSPRQAFNLACSLDELVDDFETEELDFDRLPDLYDLEQARHREAILGFLALVRERLPAKLAGMKMMGPRARRSAILRREAQRLRETPSRFPVIAAGSTGTIRATRDLLLAIACQPQGAVVLPGLDQVMDDVSWQVVGEQHPQFALKQLLASFGIARRAVAAIGPAATPRDWLASEIMRPPQTSDAWQSVVSAHEARLAAGLHGIERVETRDQREQAQVISLMLRQATAHEGATACLVTPDRDLARRVKQELAEAGLAVDDSAGEPLARFGGASLLDLLIETVQQQASAASLLALFRHPLCRFGLATNEAQRAVAVIDVAVFRGAPVMPRLAGLAAAVARARESLEADGHPPPATAGFGNDDWENAQRIAERAAEMIGPLVDQGDAALGHHLDGVFACLDAIAGEDLYADEAGEALQALRDQLQADAHYLPRCDITLALVILRHRLTAVALRRHDGAAPRIAILGLLEARLARPDLMVLGGLNEGVWPALPDAGPWLNRPMRAILGMVQPERQIGQTAHDFVQAMGTPRCIMVWAKRLGDAPAVPSRWLLRLDMLTATENAKGETDWTALARRLLAPATVTLPGKPRPKPPVAARPSRLSVSRIETLIRDPYAIYAQAVLRLEPLAEPGSPADAAIRGSLFHAIIADFTARFEGALPPGAQAEFREIAWRHLAPYRDAPDVLGFWSSQIARIGHWLIEEERSLRAGLRAIHSECGGRLDFDVAGRPFALTGRADRIDVLADGSARILDYKTGVVPSANQVKAGLAPQLTLEAAMLAAGAFKSVGAHAGSALTYIKLSGGTPPGERRDLDFKEPVMDVAHRHLAGLRELLAAYANPEKPYLPRAVAELEDEELPYDHLSRFREWALAGDAR